MPFSMMANFSFITHTHSGLSGVKGICSSEDDCIRFEFQTNIGDLGIKTDVKEICLKYEDLVGCQFKKTMLSGKAIFEGRNIKSVAKLPGADGNIVRLKIPRKDRKQAELVLSEIEYRRSEKSLRRARE